MTVPCLTLQHQRVEMSADFIERRNKTDFNNINELKAWVDKMKAKGTTWHRLHTDDSTNEMVLEGWFIRPDCQGPLP